MKRIYLSKYEKKVLRLVEKGVGKCPDNFPKHLFSPCTRSLKRKGLVCGAYVEGGEVVDSKLTDDGKMYFAENPHLYNPINWALVLSAAGVIVAILALFVACTKF